MNEGRRAKGPVGAYAAWRAAMTVGGGRKANPAASSNCAKRIEVRSPKRRATICTPTGKPLQPGPSGATVEGRPGTDVWISAVAIAHE